MYRGHGCAAGPRTVGIDRTAARSPPAGQPAGTPWTAVHHPWEHPLSVRCAATTLLPPDGCPTHRGVISKSDQQGVLSSLPAATATVLINKTFSRPNCIVQQLHSRWSRSWVCTPLWIAAQNTATQGEGAELDAALQTTGTAVKSMRRDNPMLVVMHFRAQVCAKASKSSSDVIRKTKGHN